MRQTVVSVILLGFVGFIAADSWTDSKDIQHAKNKADLDTGAKSHKSSMVLFYEPTGKDFKNMKTHYMRAAQKLKNRAAFIAIDVTSPNGRNLAGEFSASSTPALVYMENGQQVERYSGETTAHAIVKYIHGQNPETAKAAAKPAAATKKAPKKKEKKVKKAKKEEDEDFWKIWKEKIPHLQSDNFDTMTENKKIMVMFYAPWCGHCKSMKPQYLAAQNMLPRVGLPDYSLMAVDATQERPLAQKFGVRGYPTVLYLENGKKTLEASVRREDMILKFLLDPKNLSEQPEGTPDQSWDEEKDLLWDRVTHLKEDEFDSFVSNAQSAFVFYYEPDDEMCKGWKFQFYKAADALKSEGKYQFATINCKNAKTLCSNFTSFPVQILYQKREAPLKFHRRIKTSENIINFVTDPSNPDNNDAPQLEDVAWHRLEGGQHVTLLDDTTFGSFIKSKASLLVMTFASWCGHCVALKPEFAMAALHMKLQKIPGDLAAIDTDKNKKTHDALKIKAFPTLIYFKNGKKKFSVTMRETYEIVSFMENPEKPSTKKLESWEHEAETDGVYHLNPDIAKEFLKENEHVILLYYTPWCPHCKESKKGFYAAAKKFATEDKTKKFALFDCQAHGEYCTENNIASYPTIFYYSYGENEIEYQGSRSQEHFTLFMRQPTNPTFNAGPDIIDKAWTELKGSEHLLYLTGDNFEKELKERESVLVMFHAPWCGHCRAMKPSYAAAAKVMADRRMIGKLGTVDAIKDKPTASKYGAKAFPTMYYFRFGEKMVEFELDRSVKNFVTFMTNPPIEEDFYDEGEAPPPVPVTAEEEDEEEEEEAEEEEPEPQPTEADLHQNLFQTIPNGKFVTQLEPANFKNFIEVNPSVMVFFYSPVNKECKKIKDDFAEAAEQMDEIKHDGKLAAVRCTTYHELCQKEGVSGIPSFFYYKNGKKDQRYMSDTQVHNIINFMEYPVSDRNERQDGDLLTRHLMEHDFKSFLERPEHAYVMVMFYEPQREICEKARKIFEEAMGYLNSLEKKMVSVDCDHQLQLCQAHGISGYPTFKLYKKGNFVEDYPGARSVVGFSQYMNDLSIDSDADVGEDKDEL